MKSEEAFEEGKKFLTTKNYKEAIRCFTQSIKLNAYNKEARYYRAICHLDSETPKKCISDLNELIEIDPLYNKTIYIVLSIAYRREDDLTNSLKIVRVFISFI